MKELVNITLANELEITKQELELTRLELGGKEEEIRQMQKTIDLLQWRVELQETMIFDVRNIAEELLKKISNPPNNLLGKKEIMAIFSKESDFALRFLRSCKAMGYGLQIGKEYYIKQEEFEKVLENYKGLKLDL